MGAGEYISVSAQADTETADVEKERDELAKGPSARARALDELIHTYLEKGLEYNLAREVCPARASTCADSWLAARGHHEQQGIAGLEGWETWG